MTKQDACGLMVTSPVIKPTSPNSSVNSRYFWLDKACRMHYWSVYGESCLHCHIYLDGRGVNHTLLVLQTLRNSILGNHSLTGRSMGSHQDGFVAFDRGYSDSLERIQCEGIHTSRISGWFVLRDGNIGIVGWHGHLMSDSMAQDNLLAFFSGRRALKTGNVGYGSRCLFFEAVGYYRRHLLGDVLFELLDLLGVHINLLLFYLVFQFCG